MTKGLIYLGMKLANWRVPVKFVDFIIVTLANIRYGDLSKYGIIRPNMGPLLLKAKTGRSAVIDVGTVDLIKKGVIKVSTFTWYNIVDPKVEKYTKHLFMIFVQYNAGG
jgi:indole-3-pyruvate monooxygenase